MTATVADGVKGYRELVGVPLGPSAWVTIDQPRVDEFAHATGDHQWIHIDVDRARNESPFGGTIAHGYLTLSLIPTFLPQLVEPRGFTMGVNYGCDKVRFPSPVPVGSRLRGSGTVDDVSDVSGGIQIRMTITIEIEGSAKPGCVATILVRRYV